jgi:uncharacterized protein (TIGR02594 family)
MLKPPWFKTAYALIGTREIKGPKHSSTIVGWLDKLGAWWRDDETPWCGVFVAAVLAEHGYSVPRYYMRAKAWLDWGAPVNKPVLGCVAVFDRKGGGHVGFVVGVRSDGLLWVLGGNQGDAVNVALFLPSRVRGYRVPHNWPPRQHEPPPVMEAAGKVSVNEA